MNKMKRLLPILAAVCLAVSCRQERAPQSTYIIPSTIEWEEASIDKMPLSKLFPGARAIRLETNDSCLIGRNGKVVRFDSLLFVQSANDILVFSDEGKFRHRISHAGNAPQEYVQLYDFCVQREEARLAVWVSTYGGIQVYDATDGHFLRHLPVEGHVNQFCPVNDSTVLVVAPEETVFKVCRPDGTVRKRFLKKDLANSGQKICQFTRCDRGTLYQLDDTRQAVLYDAQYDACAVVDLLPPQDGVLTMADNQTYYERYGFMNHPQKIAEQFVRLSSFKVHGHQIWLTTKHPDGRNVLTLFQDGRCTSYEYFPKAVSLQNDLISTTDLRFLSTLICCDSNTGFLFLVSSDLMQPADMEQEEENPVLLVVDCP